MTRFYLWVIFFALVVPCSLYYYSSQYYLTYEKATQNRSDLLENSTEEEIVIGVVWNINEDRNLFVKGAQSAVDILNYDKFNDYITDSGAKVSRRLKLLVLSEEDSKNGGQDSANKIAKNPRVAAVIGHNGSDLSVPASITYNYNGIPYLSPVATSNLLTQHNFSYVFRNAPRDTDLTRTLIDFCRVRKYKNIAVIYCRDTYGINFSNKFIEAAAGLNADRTQEEKEPLNILLQKSYSTNQKVFLNMIAEVIESKADCIFIAGNMPIMLIKQIRQMGLRAPIIGGDGLDSSKLLELTGSFAGEIYVASVFDENLEYKTGSLFYNAKKKFEEQFHQVPDYDASQGFEAVYLLAQAFKKTQSTHPLTITSFLKVYDEFQGIAGTVSFSVDGNIEGKPVFIKEIVDKKFKRIQDKE